MKLATFERSPGDAAVGVVDTDRAEILDLAAAGVPVASMQALIEAGEAGLERARDAQRRWSAAAARPLANAPTALKNKALTVLDREQGSAWALPAVAG